MKEEGGRGNTNFSLRLSAIKLKRKALQILVFTSLNEVDIICRVYHLFLFASMSVCRLSVCLSVSLSLSLSRSLSLSHCLSLPLYLAGCLHTHTHTLSLSLSLLTPSSTSLSISAEHADQAVVWRGDVILETGAKFTRHARGHFHTQMVDGSCHTIFARGLFCVIEAGCLSVCLM